jgi:hypothetical protein
VRLHVEGEQPQALSGRQLFELIDEHGGA